MSLHDWHQSRNAAFTEVNGMEVARHYGDSQQEYAALRGRVVLIDLSSRSRFCLTGADRARFLNGQVTNNIGTLQPGDGCYAALVSVKGKMESDLHVYCLQDELLLDLEPGLSERVAQRLEKYIVADDVEVVNIAAHYGLLSIQGPSAGALLQSLSLGKTPSTRPYASVVSTDGGMGELVIGRNPRFGTDGFDVFVPMEALEEMADRISAATQTAGGSLCGWESMETVRVEAGIPRYGQDMDETIIPLEAGLEERAIRYDKGCYIGQEVINRIHSIGHVNRSLRGLVLPHEASTIPTRGDKIMRDGKAVGFVTSALNSPALQRTVAMGYVRREVGDAGNFVTLTHDAGDLQVEVVDLPFLPSDARGEKA